MLDDLDDRDDDEMDEDEDEAGEGLDDGDDDDWEDVDVAVAGDEAAAPGTAAGQVLYVEGKPVPANQVTDEHVVGFKPGLQGNVQRGEGNPDMLNTSHPPHLLSRPS